VQVNTSDEDSKSGIEPENTFKLVEWILNNCPNLRFSGLMTIGNPNGPPEVDFEKLKGLLNVISKKLKLDETDLELSMGMSHDFEKAIEMGSTNVRVGSAIFGSRQ